MSNDPYTTRPTHLRVFSDTWTSQENGTSHTEWTIDAADDAGRYTEACWTFDSSAEAFAALPDFAASLVHYDVTPTWRSQRQTAADRRTELAAREAVA